jgi:hypothetical protein
MPKYDERARALRWHNVKSKKAQKMNAMDLMRQAGSTADAYLGDGIECIDKRLGKGFAKEHPELLAAFMRTAAADFASMWVTEHIEAAISDSAVVIAGGGHE